MFSYEFYEISKNTFFAEHVWATVSKYNEIFYAFDLKNKIFAGIKFQVFAIYRTDNYYWGTAPYIILKIQMFKWSHFSQFLRLVAFENTSANKNTFKVDETRAASINVTWVSLDWLIKYFLKSVTEIVFNKALSL